jgi:hypothetical protein
MGRHAGGCSGGVAGTGEAPHLVYSPERPTAVNQIVEEVRKDETGGLVRGLLCENQPGPPGEILGASG